MTTFSERAILHALSVGTPITKRELQQQYGYNFKKQRNIIDQLNVKNSTDFTIHSSKDGYYVDNLPALRTFILNTDKIITSSSVLTKDIVTFFLNHFNNTNIKYTDKRRRIITYLNSNYGIDSENIDGEQLHDIKFLLVDICTWEFHLNSYQILLDFYTQAMLVHSQFDHGEILEYVQEQFDNLNIVLDDANIHTNYFYVYYKYYFYILLEVILASPAYDTFDELKTNFVIDQRFITSITALYTQPNLDIEENTVDLIVHANQLIDYINQAIEDTQNQIIENEYNFKYANCHRFENANVGILFSIFLKVKSESTLSDFRLLRIKSLCVSQILSKLKPYYFEEVATTPLPQQEFNRLFEARNLTTYSEYLLFDEQLTEPYVGYRVTYYESNFNFFGKLYVINPNADYISLLELNTKLIFANKRTVSSYPRDLNVIVEHGLNNLAYAYLMLKTNFPTSNIKLVSSRDDLSSYKRENTFSNTDHTNFLLFPIRDIDGNYSKLSPFISDYFPEIKS